MSYSIESAIARLQTIASGLSGMKATPSGPPAGEAVFPFAFSRELIGNLDQASTGLDYVFVTLTTEFHVALTILPLSVTKAMTFRTPFIKAVAADVSLGGSVETTENFRWSAGGMEYAGTPTYGYRFECDVKLLLHKM